MRSAARIAPSNILNFASTPRRLSSSEHVPPNIRRDVLVSCFRANRAAMSATTIERSNTTPKQPGGITGKGFVKAIRASTAKAGRAATTSFGNSLKPSRTRRRLTMRATRSRPSSQSSGHGRGANSRPFR